MESDNRYNKKSNTKDTEPDSVKKDLKRIPKSHIWGLSEVYRGDFETYREAIGQDFELIRGTTGGDDRLAIIFDPEFCFFGGTGPKLES